MSKTRSRPDLNAFERATRSPFPEVVRTLNEILGPKLVAYIAGVSETRATISWSEGSREARQVVQQRLRTALHIALLLADYDARDVAQAWFRGLNPQLDDQSPARLLRDGQPDEVGPEILTAARSFVVNG